MVKRLLHRIRYGLFFLLFLFAYLFFHSYFFLMLTIMYVFLLGISILMFLSRKNRISLFLKSDEKMVKEGQVARIYLESGEGLKLPILHADCVLECKNLFYPDRKTGRIKISCPIAAKGGVLWSEDFKVSDVGIYQFQCDTIEIWDWLGILSQTIPVKGRVELSAFPESEMEESEFSESFLHGMEKIEETIEQGNDFPEIFQIREYRPGDSVRDIHWKLTAKERSIMVKERQSLSGNCISIYIECFDDEEHSMKDVLTLAEGILKNLLSKETTARVYFFGGRSKQMKWVELKEEQSISLVFDSIFREGCVGKNSFLETKMTEEEKQQKYLLITADRNKGNELISRGKAACYLMGGDTE